jgi:hypothetical protein
METHNQNPSTTCEPVYLERPGKLLLLFKKYNITSVFDSGCKDLHWVRHFDFVENNIKYIGGEISQFMVDIAKNLFPNYEIIQHDGTTDSFPEVDLLLSSDVLIHLSSEDKIKFLKNFCASSIKYLLMTDSAWPEPNVDLIYREGIFPFENISWYKEPWNFPKAIDTISDYDNDERLKLWDRDQIQQVLDKL